MLFLLPSWVMLLLENQVLVYICLTRSHLMLWSISWLSHLSVDDIDSVALLRVADCSTVSSEIGALYLLAWAIRIWYLFVCVWHLWTYLLYLLCVVALEEIHLSIWTTWSLFEIKHIRWLLNMIILVMNVTWCLGSYVLALSHFIFTWISIVLILI